MIIFNYIVVANKMIQDFINLRNFRSDTKRVMYSLTYTIFKDRRGNFKDKTTAKEEVRI